MNTNEIFNQMLSSYDITTELQKRNAIFEVNQQIILSDLNLSTHHSELVNDGLKIICKIKVFIRSKQGKIHILRETLQSMEYTQTCSYTQNARQEYQNYVSALVS
jgi:hypothetical protein